MVAMYQLARQLCFCLSIVLSLLVVQSRAQSVYYLDTSLRPAFDSSNSCFSQDQACSSFSSIQAVSGASGNDIVRLTYSPAFSSNGQPPSEQISTPISWHRITALEKEERDALLYLNAGQIVIDMPWQCEDISSGYSDAGGVSQSGTLLFETDPALTNKFAWPIGVDTGTLNDVMLAQQDSSIPKNSSEIAFVRIIFSQTCKAYQFTQARSQVYTKLTGQKLTIQNLAFQSFSIDDPITTISPLKLNYDPSGFLSLNRVAVLGSDTALLYNSGTSGSLPTLTMNSVSIYNATICPLCVQGTFKSIAAQRLRLRNNRGSGLTITCPVPSPSNSFSFQDGDISHNTLPTIFTVVGCTDIGFDSLVFDGNEADTLISHVGSSSASRISGSVFSANVGTCIEVFNNKASILGTIFANNTQKAAKSDISGGAAIRLRGDTDKAVVSLGKGTQFLYNTAPRGGAIFVQGTTTSLVIQGNGISDYGALFRGNVATRGSGGAIFVGRAQDIDLDSAIYESNYADLSGGCAYISNDGGAFVSWMQWNVSNSYFKDCNAGTNGGALSFFSVQSLYIKSVIIQEGEAKGSGGAFALERSFISMNGSLVKGTHAATQGGVAFQNDVESGLIVWNSRIENTTSPIGAVLAVTQGLLLMDNTTIYGSTAQVGGGFGVLYHGEGVPVNWHKNDPYRSFLWDTSRQIYNISIVYSSRLDIVEQRHVKFTGVNVVNTVAEQTGDTFLCLQFDLCPGWQDQINGNNTINFLPVRPVSSIPENKWSSSDPRTISVGTFSNKDLAGGSNWTTQSVAPGQRYVVFPGQTFSIQFHVYDIYGAMMHAYSDFAIKMSPSSDNANVNLPAEQLAQFNDNGDILFENLVITGQPGAKVEISFSFTTVTKEAVVVKVPILLGICPIGYAFTSMQCSRCNGPRLYSVYYGATSCSDCPTNAICDGDSVKAKAGYYLVYKNATDLRNASTIPPQQVAFEDDDNSFFFGMDVPLDALSVPFVIATCPNTYCLEGNQCTDNRGGLLCGACKDGYSEWQGRCVECGPKNTNGGLVFLWILYLVFIFIFQHLNAQSPRSASLKILFFFTQSFLMISGPVSSQLLLWARAIFQFDLVFTGNSEGASCPFERSSYGKLLTSLLQPVAFVACLVLMFVPVQTLRGIIALIVHVKKQANMASEAEEVAKAPVHAVVPAPVPAQQLPADSLPTSPRSPGSESTVELVEVQTPGTPQSFDNIKQVEDHKAPQVKRKRAKTISKKKQKQFAAIVKKKLYKLVFGFSTWVRSLLTMLILSYQMLTVAGFGYFNCRNVGPFPVLTSATDILCTSEEYASYRWLFVLACIYAVAFPLSILIFLSILRFHPTGNKLNNRLVRRFMGALFMQYRDSCSFWMEAFVLVRRLVIVVLIVFLGSYSQAALWPILLVVLFGFLIVQLLFRPYVHWSENIAEELSIGALMLITALNMSTSLTLDTSLSTVFAIVALVVFLFTCAVVIASFFMNYWLVILIKDRLLERLMQNSSVKKLVASLKRRGVISSLNRNSQLEMTFSAGKGASESEPPSPVGGNTSAVAAPNVPSPAPGEPMTIISKLQEKILEEETSTATDTM